MKTSHVLWGPYALYGSLVLQESKTLCLTWQPCAERIKDLMSFYNGPTFTVLVKLRIRASAFSTTEEQLLGDQGMRNEAKTRPGNYSRLDIINQGECRLRTTRKQKYAAILRTLHQVIKSYRGRVKIDIYIYTVYIYILPNRAKCIFSSSQWFRLRSAQKVSPPTTLYFGFCGNNFINNFPGFLT